MRDYCPVGHGQETEKVRAMGAELEGLPPAEAKVAGGGVGGGTVAYQRAEERE